MNEDVTNDDEAVQKIINEWVEEIATEERKTLSGPTGDPRRRASLTRHDNWTNLLGIRNKPDLLTDWDHLYDLREQSALRRDCRALIERLGGPSAGINVPRLESLLTLYCKRRRVEYSPASAECAGWLDILEKLIVLPFEPATLFNVFYAITTKYVPRTSKTFDLFRLIVQYHDPELCSYLDSLKLQPEEFSRRWFASLLAGDTSRELCWRLWDEYFAKGDPFLIFFIALAFARCARDEILTMRDRQAVLALLCVAPEKMSVEDVADLLDVCYVFLNYTPLSVREDFHCMLFGANLVDECSDFPLNRLMCLPISIQELYKRVIDNTFSSKAVVTYFVIDTRSQKAFNAGSIAGSYNLNGKLIVDEPEKFNIAMTSLMRFKEDSFRRDHICFLGSGLEDDDSYMMMVISRFLQQNRPHISYVDGGYKTLHSFLADTGKLTRLSNHFNVSECAECLNRDRPVDESSGWSLMERMKKAMKVARSRRKASSAGRSTPVTLSLSKQSSREDNAAEPKHVNSTDRCGKKYRNMRSVFSINDDDDEEDAAGHSRLSDDDDEEAMSSDVDRPKLRWIDVIKKAEIIDHFQGHEVLADKSQRPCFIALSRTHMHIFYSIVKEPGQVLASHRHALSSVMRVTSKKRMPEFLTFKFGYELPTGEAHINRIHCFIIPKAGDCAKAVKTAIVALKPSLLLDAKTSDTAAAVSLLNNDNNNGDEKLEK